MLNDNLQNVCYELHVRKYNILQSIINEKSMDIPIKDLFLYYQRTIENWIVSIYEYSGSKGPNDKRQLLKTHIKYIDDLVDANKTIINELSNILNNGNDIVVHLSELYNNSNILTNVSMLRTECESYKNNYPNIYTQIFEDLINYVSNTINRINDDINNGKRQFTNHNQKFEYINKEILWRIKNRFLTDTINNKIKYIKHNVILNYIKDNINNLLEIFNPVYWECANVIKHQFRNSDKKLDISNNYENISFWIDNKQEKHTNITFNLSIFCNDIYSFINNCIKVTDTTLSFYRSNNILFQCPDVLDEDTQVEYDNILFCGDIKLYDNNYKYTNITTNTYMILSPPKIITNGNSEYINLNCKEYESDENIKRFKRRYYRFLETNILEYDVGNYEWPEWLRF